MGMICLPQRVCNTSSLPNTPSSIGELDDYYSHRLFEDDSDEGNKIEQKTKQNEESFKEKQININKKEIINLIDYKNDNISKQKNCEKKINYSKKMQLFKFKQIMNRKKMLKMNSKNGEK